MTAEQQPGEQFAESANCCAAALRAWLWLNFGWDIYDWADGDIRF